MTVPLIDQFAPTFRATGVRQGQQVTVNLEDLRGRWVILFFFPSSFSFV